MDIGRKSEIGWKEKKKKDCNQYPLEKQQYFKFSAVKSLTKVDGKLN